MQNTQKIYYVKDTFPEYLSKKDFIAASDIKTFLDSPKLYYYQKYIQKEKEEQKHFQLGSALHELVMEPELLHLHYISFPKVDRRTKEGKEAYEQYLIEAEGKTVLYDNDMEMLEKIAENARKNKTLVELLNDSHKELSCYTVDEKTGLKVRLRPDMLCKTKSTIVDIKSCLNSGPKKFKSDAYSYGYNLSAAYYLDFIGRENYVFAAMEKKQPYQISLYVCNDDMLEAGRQKYRMGLDLLKWSYDNNFWCDYNEFELLKECYVLGDLKDFFKTLEKSEMIAVL
jgi:exodeoxyribonuclease VIII